ncbi:MAG: hypothetical protein WC725_01450 [Patescibacteria group bacterium]
MQTFFSAVCALLAVGGFWMFSRTIVYGSDCFHGNADRTRFWGAFLFFLGIVPALTFPKWEAKMQIFWDRIMIFGVGKVIACAIMMIGLIVVLAELNRLDRRRQRRVFAGCALVLISGAVLIW